MYISAYPKITGCGERNPHPIGDYKNLSWGIIIHKCYIWKSAWINYTVTCRVWQEPRVLRMYQLTCCDHSSLAQWVLESGIGETHHALEKRARAHTHRIGFDSGRLPLARQNGFMNGPLGPDNKQKSTLSAKPSQYIWTLVCLQRAPHIQVVNNLISCCFF